MKLLLVAVFVVLLEAAERDPVLMKKFKEYVIEYKKDYKDPAEFERRFDTFVANLEYIDRLNKKAKGVTTYGITQFTDWSVPEFKQKMLSDSPNGGASLGNFSVEAPSDFKPASSLPRNFDWRKAGIITPVKDQGQCGSCWAFATVALMEAMTKWNTGQTTDLSEQQLLDCTQGTCAGGVVWNATRYALKGSVTLETYYPYMASKGQCRNYIGKVMFDEVHTMFYSSDVMEKAMAADLVAHGPILPSGFWVTDELMHYKGGYIVSCLNETIGAHTSLIVGYGIDDYSGESYWIFKNSWGPNWGEQGYFRAFRDRNWCKIADYVYFWGTTRMTG